MSKPQRFASPLLGTACVLALALPVAGMAQPEELAHAATVHTVASELARDEVTLTATVVAVDPDSRIVTLKGASGREVTVEAGPEVHLDHLKPGDQVTAHYQSAIALELLPADSAEAGTEVESGASSAPLNGKPGMTSGHSVSITSKLTAVDLKHHTVTLTGADGKERVIEVKDPARQARMSKLKVGDMVRITYVEAVAVTVTPKAKPKG